MAEKNEKISREENMDSIDVESIFLDIFSKCDNENKGHVKVSTLISFIAPFLESNGEHLIDLTKILDPLNMNPIISYDLFANAMKIWAQKYNYHLQKSFGSNEKSIYNKSLSDDALRQSTPIKEIIESGAMKNDFEWGLNVSNISSLSFAGSAQSAYDPVILNEQIHELVYQNKKLTDSLNDMRSQLAAVEETNNSLHNDIDKVKRSRQSDQKLIEELQNIKKEYEKEREQNNNILKTHDSVIQSLNFYKKENNQHRKRILEFEVEIQKHQEIISSCKDKENKQSAKIESYKHEIELKNEEILALQEKVEELNVESSEKNAFMSELKEELENLRYENNNLEKNLNDIKNKNTSIKPDLMKSGKYSSPVFPKDKYKKSYSSTPRSASMKKIVHNDSVFNSPRMLQMISSPISPISQNSSEFKSLSDSSRSTVIDKEIFFKKHHTEFSKDYVVNVCPKPTNKRAFSEADAFNTTTSSVDSETYPENVLSLSRDTGAALYEGRASKASRSPSPHESLQAELMKASNTACFGPYTSCEHKLKLVQYEEEIEHLQDQISNYIEDNEKMNAKITEINNLNTQLHNQIVVLVEGKKTDEISHKNLEEYEQLKKDNKDMCLENNQLKLDIALIKKENNRYSRLQHKITKLEDDIFDERAKSDRILKQNNILQSKTNEMSSNFEQKKREVEELKTKIHNSEMEISALKSELNEVTLISKKLEQEKSDVEKQLFEKDNKLKDIYLENKELKTNINELEKKFSQNNYKQLKELTEANLTLENLRKEKSDLEKHLYVKDNEQKNMSVKNTELKTKCNELTIKTNNLERKVNHAFIRTKNLEQIKYQLEEKLSKEENSSKEFKLKICELSSNIEILEQSNHQLEDQSAKGENKIKSLSALLNEMSDKYHELETENKKTSDATKRLLSKVQTLENKIQNFRKKNIDLTTANEMLKNELNNIIVQKNSIENHINFIQQQLKECTDILAKNTLLVTRCWESDLQEIVSELPVSDLADETSLAGTMQVSEGKLIDDIINLKHQIRLTGILFKSLIKIKENERLEEDSELSAVLSPDAPLLTTHTSVVSNAQGFSFYLINSPEFLPAPPMSPACTQSEMTEEVYLSCVEPTEAGVGVESPAGSVFIPAPSEGSDSGRAESRPESETVEVEDTTVVNENKTLKPSLKQHRSMSEGTTISAPLTENGDIVLFPNLQDKMLESLGLNNGEQCRDRSNERLSEEEIEAKFQTLALIFAIDAKTLAQRRELQRRQRDQADDNFAAEVARLEVGIERLAPLCVDPEIKDLVTALVTRLNIIVKAAQRISISTQVFGGVQQEYRVAAAVNLMLVHLRNIQQQRDTARRQLQCTKKMLQENTSAAAEANAGVVSVVTRRLSNTANGRVVTRRRASIATIPRPLDSPSASGPAGIAAAAKRAVRRISADAYSEHSARTWDSRHRPDWIPLERPPPPRLSRPSRIELGIDLSKIHEGSVESTMNNNEESDSDITAYETPTAVLPIQNLFIEHQPQVREPETFSDHAIDVIRALASFIAYCWNRWMQNGTTREMIFFALIFCFFFGAILVLNIMIMSKFLQQATVIQKIPWGWLTWDEFWGIFFDVRNIGPRPY